MCKLSKYMELLGKITMRLKIYRDLEGHISLQPQFNSYNIAINITFLAVHLKLMTSFKYFKTYSSKITRYNSAKKAKNRK